MPAAVSRSSVWRYSMKDLGSETYERVMGEGRRFTIPELIQVHKETKEIRNALHEFKRAGVADPLAAARAAVGETDAQTFNSHDAALSQAVQSIDWMFRASGAVAVSLGSTASAESVRDGADDSLRASINHVVARNEKHIGKLLGRMNVTTAMLERDYTVAGTILSYDDDGVGRIGAFELSDERHGRLLSVDEEGNLTLYDKTGAAMDATAYVNALFGENSVFGQARKTPRQKVIDQRA